MNRSELGRFNIALSEGEDAVLKPEFTDKLIKMALLLNDEYKAPGLATKLGCTARTVNRYENGSRTPRLRRAVKMLNLLGYDVIIKRRAE